MPGCDGWMPGPGRRARSYSLNMGAAEDDDQRKQRGGESASFWNRLKLRLLARLSAGQFSPGQGDPRSRRDHHGREQPLGRRARPDGRRRAPRGHARAAADKWRLTRRPRDRVAHGLCVLHGELAATSVRGRRADGDLRRDDRANTISRSRSVRTRFGGPPRPRFARLRIKMAELEDETAHRDRLNLWIAFDYGGQAGSANAARRIVEEGLEAEEIDELFGKYARAGASRSGSADPHLRRAPDLELPALAGRVLGNSFSRSAAGPNSARTTSAPPMGEYSRAPCWFGRR